MGAVLVVGGGADLGAAAGTAAADVVVGDGGAAVVVAHWDWLKRAPWIGLRWRPPPPGWSPWCT